MTGETPQTVSPR